MRVVAVVRCMMSRVFLPGDIGDCSRRHVSDRFSLLVWQAYLGLWLTMGITPRLSVFCTLEREITNQETSLGGRKTRHAVAHASLTEKKNPTES